MIKAELGRQLMIRVDDEVGTLAEVTSAISSYGINLIAMCAYSVDKTVAIMFVSEDNNAAKQILEKQGFEVQEQEIVLLSIDNKPGMLQVVTDKIAEAGIDLRLLYGSVEENAQICRVVLISNNNLDVMMIIKSELERNG